VARSPQAAASHCRRRTKLHRGCATKLVLFFVRLETPRTDRHLCPRFTGPKRLWPPPAPGPRPLPHCPRPGRPARPAPPGPRRPAVRPEFQDIFVVWRRHLASRSAVWPLGYSAVSGRTAEEGYCPAAAAHKCRAGRRHSPPADGRQDSEKEETIILTAAHLLDFVVKWVNFQIRIQAKRK
jgi:hypothetical protein